MKLSMHASAVEFTFIVSTLCIIVNCLQPCTCNTLQILLKFTSFNAMHFKKSDSITLLNFGLVAFKGVTLSIKFLVKSRTFMNTELMHLQ